MAGGCLTEVDLYRAFRREMDADESASALYHVLNCELCHDQWQRFSMDERVADGIRSAVIGDVAGADETPGVAAAVALPERLTIPGFTLRGDFIEGGQARVYRAVHDASREEVAIKVYHNSPLNEGGYARFSAELQSLARLRHPNVIPIRSAGEIHGHAYYVMPWIEGAPLDEYARTKSLTVRQRVQLVSKICAAVDHAHKRGVMHLDLKPSNVRVDASGEPLVMDFGLARRAAEEADGDVGIFLGIAGTPAYMAPEQVDGLQDVDTRADVFMLGLLTFEVLCGRRARTPEADAGDSFRALAAQAPPPIRTCVPGVSAELACIVDKALSLRREARYQTAEALLDDLRRYLEGAPVRAMGDSLAYRFRKLSRRHLAGLFGIVAVVTLLIGAMIVTREAQRMVDEAYRRASYADHGRFLASERSLARAYSQIAELHRKQGNAALAEDYALRAETLRKRLDVSEDSKFDVGPPSVVTSP